MKCRSQTIVYLVWRIQHHISLTSLSFCIRSTQATMYEQDPISMVGCFCQFEKSFFSL